MVELSAELLKGSAGVKRSGSSREVSGDFSPSISFSVSEPEREDEEKTVATDGKMGKKAMREDFCRQIKRSRKTKELWNSRNVVHEVHYVNISS